MLKRIEIMLTGQSAGAVRAMEETSVKAREVTDVTTARYERMGARVGKVFEKIGLESSKLGIAGSSGLTGFGKQLESTDKKAHSLGGSLASLGNKMLLGIGAGALGAGYESVKIAMSLTAAQASLQAALEASHQGWKKNTGAISTATQAGVNLGFTEAATTKALASSVISTQNLHKSLGLLPLAMDLARVKNIDLASSMSIMNKALIGNMRPLKQLGIDLNVPAANAHALYNAQLALQKLQIHAREDLQRYGDQVLKGGKDYYTYHNAMLGVGYAHLKLMQIEGAHGLILKVLNARLKDQALLFSETLPGKMEVFKAKIDQVGGSIGKWLIPKLTDAATYAQKAFDVVGKNPALLAAGAAIIGIPIIAALGSFANMHIIQPLLKLSRVFTSGDPLQGLKNFFSGKNVPLEENTGALTRLTEALTANDAALGTNDAALGTTDAALGATDAAVGVGGAAGVAGVGAATRGTGLLRGAARVAVPVYVAGVAGHIVGGWLGSASHKGDYNSQNTAQRFGSAIDPLSRYNRDPNNFGGLSGTWHALSHMVDNFKSIFSIFGGGGKTRHLNEGFATKQSLDSFAAKFGDSVTKTATTTQTKQEATTRAVNALARVLEGKSKDPQTVKILDQAGLGKFIGTSSGMLIGRDLQSALKNQTHDWNLPYVISQGFSKVNGTVGKSLDRALANSAAHTSGASRSTATAAGGLQKASTLLGTSATSLGGVAPAIDRAAASQTAYIQTATNALVAAAARLGASAPASHKRK